MILLPGATGYVGGRLLHRLEGEGLPVRCLTRRPEQLRGQVAATTEVAGGDVCDPDAVAYEIGGPDRVSYGELMREYARQRKLRRFMVPIPMLTPHLSSLWLRLVTPLYASVGRKLIDSIRHPTVVRDDSALRDFAIRPIGVRDAIARALVNEDRALAETRWSDAFSAAGDAPGFGGVRFGNRLVDSRSVLAAVPPDAAFATIRRIGGATGWYYGTWLWRVRGAIDLLCGGVGMRRGRRDPEQLRVGETLDFWRVEAIEPPRLLRLVAEMKVPGRAWLEFEVVPEAAGARIRQTAIFDPAGLAGLAYWYGIYPLHRIVFDNMLREIARAAGRMQRGVSCIPIADPYSS